MKLRHKLLLAFAGVHLALVTMGAVGKSPIDPNSVTGDTVALYSAASGADNGYGFFAPGVGTQIRTRFLLQDKHGQTWTEDLQLGRTSEANLRFTGISNLLPSLPEETRFEILRSMAGTMLGKYPNAELVVVQVDMYGFDRTEKETDFPTMKEYRDGVRPQWLPLVEVPFTRSDLDERPSRETQLASN